MLHLPPGLATQVKAAAAPANDAMLGTPLIFNMYGQVEAAYVGRSGRTEEQSKKLDKMLELYDEYAMDLHVPKSADDKRNPTKGDQKRFEKFTEELVKLDAEPNTPDKATLLGALFYRGALLHQIGPDTRKGLNLIAAVSVYAPSSKGMQFVVDKEGNRTVDLQLFLTEGIGMQAHAQDNTKYNIRANDTAWNRLQALIQRAQQEKDAIGGPAKGAPRKNADSPPHP